MPAIPAEAFDHGDVRRYNRGCTCRPCRDAWNAHDKQGKYLRANGRGRRTSPARSIAHIALLREAGMTDTEIRSAAGRLPLSTFYQLLKNTTLIHHTTESRILAIPAPTGRECRSQALVSALGSTRRLQALAADGFSSRFLAARMNRKRDLVSLVQNYQPDEEGRLSLAAARDIRALVEDLAGRDPSEFGVSDTAANRARDRAAANGWAGTAYWDAEDYDNPAFDPAVADDPVWFALAENTLELQGLGLDWEQAADRLDTPVDELRAAVARYHSGTYATEGWKCNRPGCSLVRKTRGMCDRHYKQSQREAALAARLEVAA